MMKNLIRGVFVACALLIGFGAFAQSQTLSVTTNKPAVDGTISPGEYTVKYVQGKVTIYLSRTTDTLYIGIVGGTTGWVAVGLGSLKMDGAVMFMGYVADGKPQFTVQQGTGHRHRDLANADPISYAVTQADTGTVMEIAVKADSFITADQTALDMIFANGGGANFTLMHVARGSLEVPLK